MCLVAVVAAPRFDSVQTWGNAGWRNAMGIQDSFAIGKSRVVMM